MRTVTLLTMMLVLLSTLAQALVLGTTVQGDEPVVAGDTVAFLTFEDAVDQDLNGDGDLADHVVQYFTIHDRTSRNTGAEGKHVSVSGSMIAFEDKARLLTLYDLDGKKTIPTTVRGTQPSLAGKRVAFATAESDETLDLNGDGDQIDTVIRYYDSDTKSVTNTRAVGMNPLLLGSRIVFSVNESAADVDVNNDGDRNDLGIRYYDVSTQQITNTHTTGTLLAGSGNTVIVADNEQFWALDLASDTSKPLGILGNHPSLSNSLLVYERDGELWFSHVSTRITQPLNITGKEPSLDRNTLAFVAADKTITVLIGQDPDNDAVPDFADNCLAISNADQADADADGLGDACDTLVIPANISAADNQTIAAPSTNSTENSTAPAVTAEAAVEMTTPAEALTPPFPAARKPLPEIDVRQETRRQAPTYWFLMAVGILAFAVLLVFIVPRWLRTRKKGFGF